MIAQRLVRTDGCFLWSGVGDRLRSFGSQKKVIPQDDNDSFRFLGSEDRGAGGARGHGGSVLFGDVFDLLKDVLQVGAREEAAVEDDAADFLRVANVVEGIGVQEHEVGNLALFDGAELILHGEEMRRMERGRLKSFERSKARGDEALHFLVQTEAGKNVHAGRSVGASEKGHTGLVEQPDDFKFLVNEFFAAFERLGIEIGFDFFGEFFPGLVFPGSGNVFSARVFAEIGYIDEVAATFPNERGALPGLILGEERGEFGSTGGVVGFEKFGFAFATLKEGVLEGRTAFEDADEVFEAVHTGVGHFAGADRIGDVAGKGNFLLAGFFDGSENGIAGDQRLKLDEVGAGLFEVVDGAAGVFRRGNGDGTRKARFRAVEHGAGGHDPRTEEAAAFDFVAPILYGFEVAAHVANAGDSIGDEKRQRDLLGTGKPIAEFEMDVHVPETGDEVRAAGVDVGGSVAWIMRGFAGAGVEDSILLDDDDLVRTNLAGADVHDVGVRDDHSVLQGPALGGKGQAHERNQKDHRSQKRKEQRAKTHLQILVRDTGR